jgi:large subunit ribosomal protein L3
MQLLGRKIGMTQLFDAHGNLLAVTAIELGPCTVLQKKTPATDGYHALQLGFGQRKEKNTPKPLLGHFKKANATPVRFVREWRTDTDTGFNVGDTLTVAAFKAGDYVDVIGVSKGRGFQGVVKRHKFRGGDASHGAKGWHRRPGAIGQRSFPGRVFRGMRMPGHMGHRRVTTQNLRVVQVREAENLLLVEGAVPGPSGGLLIVRHAKKKTKPAPQPAP